MKDFSLCFYLSEVTVGNVQEAGRSFVTGVQGKTIVVMSVRAVGGWSVLIARGTSNRIAFSDIIQYACQLTFLVEKMKK